MIHFLYASDEGFSSVLKASLNSLFDQHQGTEVTVHIIGQELSTATMESIQQLATDYGQNVHLIEMPNFDEMLGRQIDPKQYTLSAFSRLFVDALVPGDLKRIIYLDCDTTVTANLQSLWDYELDGAVIGAVNDCRSWRYSVHLGLPKDATYINSGVLLIDLECFRAGNWREKFKDGILRYDGLLEFPDNDLICMLMQDDMKILPPRYNVISPVRNGSWSDVMRLRRPSVYYSRQEFEEAKQNPAVLHYTRYFAKAGRPWNEGYDHEDGRVFRRHLAATGGEIMPTVATSKAKYLAIKALEGPLRPLAATGIGLVHSIVKPNLARRERARIQELQKG